MYLLGYDIGSSSVKVSLVEASAAATLATAQSPQNSEMQIHAPRPGWAEQDPEIWWQHARQATRLLLRRAKIEPRKIAAIGIAYQMHGLVAIGRDGQPLRPAIIWCDSRAVEIGERAFRQLGEQFCLQKMLNSPGNFTASKLGWVAENEPHVFEKIWKIMLPGDYIAAQMTGEFLTTASGLSEGILWDFQKNEPARELLRHFNFSENLLPPLAPTFGKQGNLTKKAAASLGLPAGIPVTYRAGDQPNNALSLNALRPGEVAATGGTSGVVYGISERLAADPLGRVNSFAHVNHSAAAPRIGVLLCLNGAGSQYAWVRRHFAKAKTDYFEMEKWAATVPPGSEGLRILPFGNGAERIFENRNLGGQILNLNFNLHREPHFCRAALEGVAFSFVVGMQILQKMGVDVSLVRVGNDNLFQSQIFSKTISTLVGCRIEMLRTTGATGAAIASGVGIGLWSEASEGLQNLEKLAVVEPDFSKKTLLTEVFEDWRACLARFV